MPVPSWPKALSPQHLTPPLSSRTQLKSAPATTFRTLLSPATSTGTGSDKKLVPLPSWPCWLLMPQHLTVRAAVNAQACNSPIEMAEMPEVNPSTSAGVSCVVGGLKPDRPSRLLSFAPQHLTPPARVTTQLRPPNGGPNGDGPRATSCTTPLSSPTTSTGLVRKP